MQPSGAPDITQACQAIRRCYGLALLGCFLLACGGTQPPPSESTSSAFRDPEGKPLALEQLPAHRIVSSMQSATEWLIALGAADLLVARTDYDRQPELAALPSIGGGMDPSAEQIASLHPDLVIGWENRSSSDLQRALKPFQIPVISMETTDTADLFRNLTLLGEIAGKVSAADSLARDLRQHLTSLRNRDCPADPASRETVLLVLWTDPAMTTGSGTWLNTVMEAACLRNVFDDLKAPWPTVGIEAIVDRDPDWILISTGAPGQRIEQLQTRNGWRSLRAVRLGQILEVPGDLLARAGPNLAATAESISTALQEKRGRP